jgi:hypothetical protein
MSFFLLFSSTKSENKRVKQILPGWGGRGIGTSERRQEGEYCAKNVYTCM